MAYNAQVIWQALGGGRYRNNLTGEEKYEPSPSETPNVISEPPVFLTENIYKDEGGVIRGEGGGGGYAQNAAAYAPREKGYSTQRYQPAGETFGPAAPGGGRGGAAAGPSFTGTIRSQYSGFGGGGDYGTPMAGGSTGMIRTQYSQLDPNIWNTPVQYGSATGAAGTAGGYAAGLADLQPGAAPQERTLYDRYSQLLQDPSSIMGNQGVQFALQEAQRANQRQLAAGRMRQSGNALRSMSDVTTGTLMQQFGNLANIYGGGAGAELARNQLGAQTALEQSRQRGGFLQGAGNLALGAGQLYGQTATQGLEERKLDLARVGAGIQSASEGQAQQLRAEALRQASAASPYGGGTFSPDLAARYQSVTGSPLSIAYQPGSFGGSGSFFSSVGTTPGYYY